MDPLRCLRDFCMKNRLADVKNVEGHKIAFGDEYEFSSATETAFARGKGKDSNKLYTLGELLFFVKCRQDPAMPKDKSWNAAYIAKAIAAHIDRIALPDQKNLYAYLIGEADYVDNLKYDSPALLTTQKRSREEGAEAATDSKRPRFLDYEVQLRGRHNMLNIEGKDFRYIIKKYEAARAMYSESIRLKEKERAERHAKAAQAKGAARHEVPRSSRLDRGPQAESQQAQRIGVKYYRDERRASAAHAGAPPPPPRQAGPSGGHHGHGEHGAGWARPRPSDMDDARPIVVVPSIEGPAARVTLQNVKQLLEGGEFVESMEAKRRFGHKEHFVRIQRASTANAGRVVQLEVVDRPPSLQSRRWQRVAAVVCIGKKWQLKDFPFSGDPLQLFNAICGFYFHFEDEPIPAEVQGWNVTMMPLKRNTRHDDVTLAGRFFDVLQRFLDNKIKLGCPKGSQLRPDKLVYK